MSIKIIHVSDIHLGSGQNHGRVNPETGINTRVEDFYNALSTCIDDALRLGVDAVLFTGDAFPDATPAPWLQHLFAKQFLRLAEAGIAVIFLVGNHDQHSQGEGGASLSIYRALNVSGVIVGDTLGSYKIATRHGWLQVVTLPWVTRSMLVTKPETQGLSMSEINDLLLERLRHALAGEIALLDPDIPTVLAAHVMLDKAVLGAERLLSAGKTLITPLSLVADPAFDYVALGHIHRHQVLWNHPPVVYAGSIERVDFSEENEAKGYVLVELERGKTQFEFCPLPTRSMHTIRVDLTYSNYPHQDLLTKIGKASIEDAIIRLIYRIKPEQADLINQAEVRSALAAAHSFTIQAELVSEATPQRGSQIDFTLILDPIATLEQYIDEYSEYKSLKSDIIFAAQALLKGEEPDWSKPSIKQDKAESKISKSTPIKTPQLPLFPE